MSILKNMAILTGVLLTAACGTKALDSGAQSGGLFRQGPAAALDFTIGANRSLQIVDESGNGVAGAQILIGNGLDAPFKGNYLKTDGSGSISAPEAWVSPLTVTLDAPGFVRTSYFSQTPKGQTLQILRATPWSQKREVRGNTVNFGNFPQDGYAHFALVLPMLNARDVFSFSIQQIMSFEVDHLNVMGYSIPLPSNLTLPRQSQNYGFFPVTLDKPQFHMPVFGDGLYKMAAIHGKFPFKKVVDAIRGGKKLTDVFNDFTFLTVGMKDADVRGGDVYGDISVSDLGLRPTVPFQVSSMGPNEEVISLMIGYGYNKFMPFDVKLLKSNQSATLMTPTQYWDQRFVVSIKVQEEGTLLNEFMGGKIRAMGAPKFSSAMSFHVQSAEGSRSLSPNYLPYIDRPAYQNGKLTMNAPKAGVSAAPVMTMAQLCQKTVIKTELGNMEQVEQKWHFYSQGWTNEMELPQWPGDRSPAGNHWEVFYMGKDTGSNLGILSGISHVTRNALDF